MACLLMASMERSRGVFFVEGLSAVGAERRRNTERVLFDKRVRGRVPVGIASGLECGADAAGREAGAVRLALDELLAGEIHDDRAVAVRADKRVVLFRRSSRQRLEPVCKMGRSLFQRPVLHLGGDDVGHVQRQIGARVDGVRKSLICSLRRRSLMTASLKTHTSKNFIYFFHGSISPVLSCSRLSRLFQLSRFFISSLQFPPTDAPEHAPENAKKALRTFLLSIAPLLYHAVSIQCSSADVKLRQQKLCTFIQFYPSVPFVGDSPSSVGGPGRVSISAHRVFPGRVSAGTERTACRIPL